MCDAYCFMLSRVCLGDLHSGCVRQLIRTEKHKCWNNPTIPRQRDTTGSLRSHLNFMEYMHSYLEIKGQASRDVPLHYRMTSGHKQTDSTG